MLSSRRVRGVDGGWIPVIGNRNRDEGGKIHRTRLSYGDETIFTLFIDNLPEDVSHSWLKKLFSNYGVVIAAFIPEKRSKVTGRKFGFIRYNCSISAEELDKWGNVEKSHEKATLNIIAAGNGWLNRSVVAKSFKRIKVEELKTEIAKENICDIHIRSMGGRNFLLSFSDTTRRDTVIKETLMQRWFSEITPWNGEPASLERCVWLSCSGRVLIATESSSIIDERISLEGDERSPDISSENSDFADIDSLVEESLVGKAENTKVTAFGEDDDHMDNNKTKG
ncbi:hypothetical protein Vadar_033833 [Vaccinium darrowii]|uniref:Uncharacterized protein n=1 Tax=Vaccinium darrowii TaxID=229202 RepID=A0ACB7Y3T5_9ERIC|nr:hypothetical protein Vadar_033833 [Vaccinium darrowii]